ncbi:hypothetical protein ENUP19_0198G0003 [Entamoeba nuttalli]|uniref:Uncharacterized protein n=1 Tax=Entamoeba nuttalli TaxID=412467 RepID=A0ABQ0DNF6_9EUKA
MNNMNSKENDKIDNSEQMLTKHSNTERLKRSAEIAYLKEYYPLNLVQFHKIIVKLQNAPENEKEVVVEPDVDFQIDGNEYLVF